MVYISIIRGAKEPRNLQNHRGENLRKLHSRSRILVLKIAGPFFRGPPVQLNQHFGAKRAPALLSTVSLASWVLGNYKV